MMAEVDSDSDDIYYSADEDACDKSADHSPLGVFVGKEFSTKSWKTDMALVVQGNRFYVSKHVLAVASPVFDAMFDREFKEKHSNEVPLPGKKHGDVLEFLRCLYPRTSILNPVTFENVFRVLPLADEYQVSVLQSDCVKCLMKCLSDDIPAKRLYKILMMANMYHLDKVKEKCINIVVNRPLEELNKVGFSIISDDIKADVCAKMLNNLDAKYKTTFKKVETANALSKFLGASAKKKNLANKYDEGRLVGSFKSITCKIRHDFERSVTLKVNGKTFTFDLERDNRELTVDCTYGGQSELTTFGAVVVNNKMKGKDDFIKTVKEEIYGADTWDLATIDEKYLKDESLGFIDNGKLSIDLYMFIIKDS